eukprot:1838416-Pyramimonas_sp.AAC.1
MCIRDRGNRDSPPPSEVAPVAFWGGHLRLSVDPATVRQIHGSLIHVCAPPRFASWGRDYDPIRFLEEEGMNT